jgi:uncharacterized protein YutE (UPF0331/DUF86 family)
MNETEKPYEAYVYAVREQVEQHLAALDELSARSEQRPLSFIDRNAVERSLQIVVEAAIGCSKHYLKQRKKPVPSEARGAIERVYELAGLTDPDIATMRGAIGMRNAIIHDYLNLDWARIEAVLAARKYHQVWQYVTYVSNKLLLGPASF